MNSFNHVTNHSEAIVILVVIPHSSLIVSISHQWDTTHSNQFCVRRTARTIHSSVPRQLILPMVRGPSGHYYCGGGVIELQDGGGA